MLKPVDQFHKVATPEDQAKKIDPGDIARSAEAEALAKKEEAIHEGNVKIADAYWSQKAKEKDWDCVKPDLAVYKYCGKEIKSDPRRTEEYRDKVVEGLGFKLGEAKPGLTQHDVAAIIEVLRRKAGAFWIEGEPRTALKYILHDTIPTGPPCRTPPHRLKGERPIGLMNNSKKMSSVDNSSGATANGPAHRLPPRTLLNTDVSVSAAWSWTTGESTRGYCEQCILFGVPTES